RRDHLDDAELGLERLDLALQEAPLLARGVVLGVLLEVAMLARRGDPADDLGPGRLERFELGLQPRQALLGHLDRIVLARPTRGALCRISRRGVDLADASARSRPP